MTQVWKAVMMNVPLDPSSSWVSCSCPPLRCGGFGGCQYFEATQIGSLSAIINSICSHVFLLFTLPDRFFSIILQSPPHWRQYCPSLLPQKVALYKHPPGRLYKDMVCKSFLFMLSVDFLVSSPLFLLFCPFASSFFSNSERILTEKKCCIYFLIYACATIQRFGAAVLAVSSVGIHWVCFEHVWRQILKMCSSDTCWCCFERQHNILDDSLRLSFTVSRLGH